MLWSTEQNKKMEEVSMNSTALGAKKENINFISEAHEKFYYEKIQKVREADVYHKADKEGGTPCRRKQHRKPLLLQSRLPS